MEIEEERALQHGGGYWGNQEPRSVQPRGGQASQRLLGCLQGGPGQEQAACRWSPKAAKEKKEQVILVFLGGESVKKSFFVYKILSGGDDIINLF